MARIDAHLVRPGAHAAWARAVGLEGDAVRRNRLACKSLSYCKLRLFTYLACTESLSNSMRVRSQELQAAGPCATWTSESELVQKKKSASAQSSFETTRTHTDHSNHTRFAEDARAGLPSSTPRWWLNRALDAGQR